MSVWVIAEHRNGALREVTGELLGAAEQLGAGPVTAVVLAGPGEGEALCAALPGSPAGVLRVEHPELVGFNGAAVAEALRRLIAD